MLKKFAACFISFMMAFTGTLPFSVRVFAEEATNDEAYKIYPTVHSIEYQDGGYNLQENVNVIYDKEIDDATKARMNEVAALKNLTIQTSDQAKSGMTNIYVGVYGSKGFADAYIRQNNEIDPSLFEKNDAYFLKSNQQTIAILGKDSDSAFYGLTTLYHIFAQMESYHIRNFTINDYADIVSRGFIEGYYGNPWSTQDRINLMNWSGYYKLNSYFYAPKDDLKHNKMWRELYSDEEINTKIKPLAEAGNASKCRFVFALHPFQSDPIRFNTDENYNADLKVLQDKFKQTIEVGVRQIAILADDAGNSGAENYTRLLKDMTAWLKEMQKTYPDLKLTLPFVTAEYMHYGENYYHNFPDNVQIVMTGGKVWGEVSNNFTQTFTKNAGRGPYLWINWPCTDNSKKHLIMGGYDTFLEPGVNPDNIQGIVLNPMQQSEPSKVAIFGNAEYSWNIWQSKEKANEAWEDSFSFVDHNNALANDASNALKELSKHMMNQNMDTRVKPLQESVELNKLLAPFKEKLDKQKPVSIEETNALIQEFEKLAKASKTYRNHAGNEAIKDQMIYWLNSFDDTTAAAIAYLNGVKATLQNDTASVMENMAAGKKAFEKSKSYGFHYVDHTEYAEIGVQHIVPFIEYLDSYLSNYTKSAVDPSIVTKRFITSRQDTPIGNINNVFDGNVDTSISYQHPNLIYQGDYVGAMFSKKISITSMKFILGGGKNHFEECKLQYTQDGKTWVDLNNQTYTGVLNKLQEIYVENLDIEAMGIRLIATKDNLNDAYLNVNEIEINDEHENSDVWGYHVIKSSSWSVYAGSAAESALYDGNDNTFVWYSEPGDTTYAGDYLGYNFGKVIELKSLHLVVGNDNGNKPDGDKLDNYKIETSLDGNTWESVEGYDNYQGVASGKDVLDIDLHNTKAKYIRVVNLKDKKAWLKFSEFTVKENQTGDLKHVYTNITDNHISSIITPQKAALNDGSLVLKNQDYIGLQLDNIKHITDIHIEQVPTNVVLETSLNGIQWTPVENTKDSFDAKYIRLRNTKDTVTMELKDFYVTLYTAPKAKLLECNTPIAGGWGPAEDMRSLGNDFNIFDQNINTGAEIGGFPQAGQYAIFDLGQTYDIHDFRYYVVETQPNYLRDGVFEIAAAPDAKDDEWTELLSVGDGKENTEPEDASNTAKNYSELTHDSSHPGNMYKEATNLQASGRYLRLRFTASNNHRAVYMNELLINGGVYVSPENNRDVVASVVEEKGKIPSNMFDGNLSTTYKPSEKNGEFTYRLSKPENVKTIRIVQSGEMSNAVVRAILANKNDLSKTTTVTLGTLNLPLNEFVIPDDQYLLSIQVQWTDKLPEISEILTLDKTEAIDKTELQKVLQVSLNEKWTSDTKQKFEDAKVNASAIYENTYVSQNSIDMAVNALQSVIKNALIQADTTALKAYVKEEKPFMIDDVQVYTGTSYDRYKSALNNIKDALNDEKNISEEDAQTLETAIKDAKEHLVYSTMQSELAENTLANDEGKFIEANYSVMTYQAYQKAKEDMTNDIQNSTDPVNMAKARIAYKESVNQLADITELQNLHHDFNNLNKDLYETTTYQAYEKAVNDTKELFNTGTIDTVKKAIDRLQEAKAGLLFKGNVMMIDMIKELEKISPADYTKASFEVLSNEIELAKADVNNSNADIIQAHIQKLKEAQKQLVDIRNYLHVVETTTAYQKADYTKDSFNALQKVLHDTAIVKQKATAAEVEKACQDIQNALKALDPLAKDLESYRTALTKEKADVYTESTYQLYAQAYQKLMALDAENTNIITFLNAKDAYETAYSNLAFKQADYQKVDAAIQKVPTNLSVYTKQSVAALQKAIDAVHYGYMIQDQNKVDHFAESIESAVKGLVYLDGDYTKVHQLMDQVPSDLNNYTSDSVKYLNSVIHDIDYHKNILEQNQIDAYAKNLQKAINNLEVKTAIQNTPDTSDHSNPWMAFMALLISGGVCISLWKRNKKHA